MPQIPQIPQKIYLKVHNNSGGALLKNRAIRVSGTSSGVLGVDYARADISSAMPVIGVTEDDIAFGADGLIVVFGEINNIDTSALVAGTKYYVATGAGGTYTATKPTSPNLAQAIIVCLTSHATTGSIWVDTRSVLPEMFSSANNGLVPTPSATAITNLWPLLSTGDFDGTVGAAILTNVGGNTQDFRASSGGSGQAFWSFQEMNGSGGYLAVDCIQVGGSSPYFEMGPYNSLLGNFFFISASSGKGVIASDWISVPRLASPGTVGPTLFSNSYPGYYAGTDDDPYFKSAAGIVKLDAPMITQDEGVQVALNTKTMNFTGAGVTATAVGETVNVNIPGVVNAATTGTAEVDFGAFPGASDASIAVTGQAGILAGSIVECWLRLADTADHTADEHLVETIKVAVGNIVAGTGFTIYAVNTNQLNEPVTPSYGTKNSTISGATLPSAIQTNQRGGRGTRLWGKWSVQWRWV